MRAAVLYSQALLNHSRMQMFAVERIAKRFGEERTLQVAFIVSEAGFLHPMAMILSPSSVEHFFPAFLDL